MNSITLLSLSLLEKHAETLSFVEHIKKRRGVELGWHYVLDLVWILENLKCLKPGTLILDAGAGGGLLQFILVELGYRVLSVDFNERKTPNDVDCLQVKHQEKYTHSYLDHLEKNYGKSVNSDKVFTLKEPTDFVNLMMDNKRSLVLYQADLKDMRLCPDNFVDCVVSVSALEHIDYDQISDALRECFRVLKKRGEVLITTSATDKDDWYHKSSRGWCFSEKSLKEFFDLRKDTGSNFNRYAEIFTELNNDQNYLAKNLASFYFLSDNNGMPLGKWNPTYLPVGVQKTKK